MLPIYLTIVFEVFTLLVAGAGVFLALSRIYSRFRSSEGTNWQQWLLDFAWLAITLFVTVLWPNISFPGFHPWQSFLFYAAVAAFLAEAVFRKPGDSFAGRTLKVIGKVLLGLGSLVALYSALRYLLMSRSSVEGLDFFYYITTSRHMTWGMEYLSMDLYFYFPGIYAFWRFVIHLTGGSLESIQSAFIAVLGVNSLLIGWNVARVTRNPYAGVLALLWYIVFCYRFEGFFGISEPIATLPILAGLLIWSGQSFAGRWGLVRLIALGAGLGLGLYVRQYAGLVSLGAFSLLITFFLQDRSKPIVTFGRLMLLPVISAAVCLAGILLEGYGLQPLLISFQTIAEYGTSGSLLDHISELSQRAVLLSICGTISLGIWLLCVLSTRFRNLLVQPWCQMVGFTCLGGFFSLLAFISRSYPHYALFAGAMLIISSAITVTTLIRAMPASYKRHAAFHFAFLVLFLFPLVKNSPTSFYVWPIEAQTRASFAKPWYLRPGPSAELATMKSHLAPKEYIYVLPPSQNEIHFLLGTRYPNYGWYLPVPLTTILQSPDLQGVIVLSRDYVWDYYVDYADRKFQYDRAEEILTAHHYQPVVKLPSMVLWRKTTHSEIQSDHSP